ncbi:TPA: hypothetical protein P5S08_003728 [Salmonella enterica subsp. enterica serovar Concord]|nr:hypothetical protein [Salmonella enterica subsp. enterica serovar Concord]
MSNLSDSIICIGADVISYTDKKTGEPRVMCRINTLADYLSDDRSVGFGFIAEEVSDADVAMAVRLQSDYKQAVAKGYDFLCIVPHFKRAARGRGDGKSIISGYELAGYGSFQRFPLDSKQPVDGKQSVKS